MNKYTYIHTITKSCVSFNVLNIPSYNAGDSYICMLYTAGEIYIYIFNMHIIILGYNVRPIAFGVSFNHNF